MARIDGKYEVLQQQAIDSGNGGKHILYTVQALPKPGESIGETLRLTWFEVSTPEERTAFHQYRSVLKALNPAGLSDVVARPGAYYALWHTVSGQALSAFQAQSTKNETALRHLRLLAEQLISKGYALSDAEIVMDGDHPKVAYLPPVQRSQAEARALNESTFGPLSDGKIRRERPRLSVWSWLPGLACMVWAGYMGVQATQIYLNPAITDVPNVVGQPGDKAALALSKRGFRVQYSESDSRQIALGSVISQEPVAGSNLHLGRLVTLIINNPPALKVPRLENLTVDQAKAVLSENMLKLSTVSPVDGTVTGIPKGFIVAQLPPADSIIRRGQPVRLLVSSGVTSPQTWLPDLRGLSFEDATALVKRAGMVVHTINRQSSEQAEGTVLRQSPAAYDKANIGSPVTLVVAKAPYQPPAQVVTPLPVPPPPPPPVNQNPEGASAVATSSPDSEGRQTVAMTYTFPADLGNGKVEIVVSDDDGERVILPPTDALTVAGATAQRDDVKVRGSYAFIVRVDGKDYATFGP